MVEFRNAYGELPAAQIAKLPFYGALTIVYAVIGMYVGNVDDGGGNADNLLDFGHSYTCRIVMTSVNTTISSASWFGLTSRSAGTKLHNCHPCVFDSRTIDDLGFLWYVSNAIIR